MNYHLPDTRIKICGITSVDDARLSLEAGADYLGLIFSRAPRRVTRRKAMAIREAVPQAMLIGVFEDAPIGEVVSTGRSCGLNLIQLQGNESSEYCDALVSRLSLPVIKVFDAGELADTRILRGFKRTSYFMLDLDRSDRASREREGLVDRLLTTAAEVRGMGYRIFLGGGLNPDNVREAVMRVGPYAINVAGGVEKAPGVKDSKALSRFVEEARP